MFNMKIVQLFLILLLPTSLMGQSTQAVNADFLASFADAFNAHDLNAIMAHMTDDCIFQASAGPDQDGEEFAGQDEVRKAFEDVFKNIPNAQWREARHFVVGDRGFSEWIFSGTRLDGTKVEVTGCDLFTFKDGKIFIKNSYRKNRLPDKR